MDLAKLVSTAQSLELATKEIDFLKNNNLHFDTNIIRADTISDDRWCNSHLRGGEDFKKQKNKKQLKFLDIVGRK